MIEAPSQKKSSAETNSEARPPVSEAARRALAEAEARRKMSHPEKVAAPREIDGREGPEPVRYGDWENKGIATDF